MFSIKANLNKAGGAPDRNTTNWLQLDIWAINHLPADIANGLIDDVELDHSVCSWLDDRSCWDDITGELIRRFYFILTAVSSLVCHLVVLKVVRLLSLEENKQSVVLNYAAPQVFKGDLLIFVKLGEVIHLIDLFLESMADFFEQ